MKIGIITQPLQNNYGGILQNYALQDVLKRWDMRLSPLIRNILKFLCGECLHQL